MSERTMTDDELVAQLKAYKSRKDALKEDGKKLSDELEVDHQAVLVCVGDECYAVNSTYRDEGPSFRSIRVPDRELSTD